MSYLNISYDTTPYSDVYQVYGLTCADEDHFCDCVHFYCDGSVVYNGIDTDTTTYNNIIYGITIPSGAVLLEDGTALLDEDGNPILLDDG